MEQLELKRSNDKALWALVGAVFAIFVFTTKQPNALVIAAAVLLAAVSLCPFYFWLRGLSSGLPLWPVFALISGLTTALPMAQAPEAVAQYSAAEVILGGLTVAGFVVIGTFVWISMTSGAHKAPERVFMISSGRAESYLFGFVLAGLLFQFNQIAWWFELPGNSMQVVRGIAMSLNTMGIFVLAFYHGRGLLSKRAAFLLVFLTAATALSLAAGLILASAIVPVAMYLLGELLGRGAVPWRSMGIVLCALALLHPGKYAMRKAYWEAEDRPRVTLSGIPQFYWDWINFGLEESGVKARPGPVTSEEEITSSVFERAGNLHMLLLVQRKSPGEVPFLDGITYEHIPRMLLPRFLDSGKGISHAGNVLLTVNYGVQTLDQTATTSIAWGLIAEAYANFGYVGVALLAVLLGAFYGFMARLTVGVPMTSLRFVLGLLVLAAATKADTMGVFVTTQFQGMAGLSLAAVFLMRSQPNPFAQNLAIGAKEQSSKGRRQKAHNRTPDTGLPAPGGLVSLIEGAQLDAATAHSAPVAPERHWRAGAESSGRDERKPPMRATAWMPRSLRMRIIARQREEAAAAARAVAVAPSSAAGGSGNERPRQVAVPYQNYRKFRGRT